MTKAEDRRPVPSRPATPRSLSDFIEEAKALEKITIVHELVVSTYCDNCRMIDDDSYGMPVDREEWPCHCVYLLQARLPQGALDVTEATPEHQGPPLPLVGITIMWHDRPVGYITSAHLVDGGRAIKLTVDLKKHTYMPRLFDGAFLIS